MKIFTSIVTVAVLLLLLVSCTDDNDTDAYRTKSSKARLNYEMHSKPGDTIIEPPVPPQISPGEPVPPKGKD